MPMKPRSRACCVNGLNSPADDRAATSPENLDRPYLEKWAQALGVSAELHRLLRGEIKPKRT